MEITSTPNEHGFYEIGEEIRVRVRFSEAVKFNWRRSGHHFDKAYIGLKIDGINGKEKSMDLSSEAEDSDGMWLDFTSRVSEYFSTLYHDTDGIRIPAGIMELYGDATIKGKDNDVDLYLKHEGVDNGKAQSKHKIEFKKPFVRRVWFFTPAKSKWKRFGSTDITGFIPYNEDKEILIKVKFTEKVIIGKSEKSSSCEGNPYLKLRVGDHNSIKNACFNGRDPDDNMVPMWKYTVKAGDTDSDGVTIDQLRFLVGLLRIEQVTISITPYGKFE